MTKLLFMVPPLLAAVTLSAAAPAARHDKLPGWRTDFEACRAEADRTGRPFVLVWGAALCPHCRELKADLATNGLFRAWMEKRSDYIFCTVQQSVGARDPKFVKKAKVFAASAGGTKTAQPPSFPYVCLYRKAPERKVQADSFSTESAVKVMEAAERLFSDAAPAESPAPAVPTNSAEEVNAAAFLGFYTVQLPCAGAMSNALVRGAACLTLDVRTSPERPEDLQVKYSGAAPDGSLFEGTAPLSLCDATNGTGVCARFARADIVAKTATGVMELPLKIKPFAAKAWRNPSVPEGLPAVFDAAEGTNSCHWTRTGGVKVPLRVYGAFLRRNTMPRKICDHFDLSRTMKLRVKAKKLESERYGAVVKWPSAKVAAGTKTFAATSSIGNVSLTYSGASGVVGGVGEVRFAEKSLRGKFYGVVLPGWINCHCGTEFKARPIVAGSFSFEDLEKDGDDWRSVVRSVPFEIIAK